MRRRSRKNGVTLKRAVRMNVAETLGGGNRHSIGAANAVVRYVLRNPRFPAKQQEFARLDPSIAVAHTSIA